MPKATAANGDERLNVRLRQDIRWALGELRDKRYREVGILTSINGLVVEAIHLLLHHEGITPKPAKAPLSPPRKPAKSARVKRVTMAVRA